MFNCNCKYYSVHSIRSHTAACAKINDHLSSFLKWHSINKKKANKYKQATHNLNLRCIGQKGNVQRRRRTHKTNLNNMTTKTSILAESSHKTQQSTTLSCREARYGCRKAIGTPPPVLPPPMDFVSAAKVNYSFSHLTTGHLVIKRDKKHFHCKHAHIKDYLHIGVQVCSVIKSRLTQLHCNPLSPELGV